MAMAATVNSAMARSTCCGAECLSVARHEVPSRALSLRVGLDPASDLRVSQGKVQRHRRINEMPGQGQREPRVATAPAAATLLGEPNQYGAHVRTSTTTPRMLHLLTAVARTAKSLNIADQSDLDRPDCCMRTATAASARSPASPSPARANVMIVLAH